MKVLLVVALVLGAALAAPKAGMQFRNLFKKPVGAPKHHPSGRITNGQVAEPHSIPYQAFLEVHDESGSGWYCGGSLISESVVLTAGHCGYQGNQAIITLGAQSPLKNEDTQVKVTSKDIVVHEKFDMNAILNDIALIRLPEPVTLNENIKTVELPAAADAHKTYEGETARVSGWGLTDGFGTSLSEELRYTEDKIISNKACGKIFGKIHDYQVCLNGAAGHGSCNGDSGGPLTVDGVQIGVVSYGIYFCFEGYPTVYTRTNSFLDWIAENSSV